MVIDLDPENITPNPVKRAVTKICLNFLWGKFGRKQNVTQTEYLSNTKRWYKFCGMIDTKSVIISLIMKKGSSNLKV